MMMRREYDLWRDETDPDWEVSLPHAEAATCANNLKQAYEFLHLLTNIRHRDKNGVSGESAITILLSGHPQLLDHLNEEPSFCQRMHLAWRLEPLSEQQTIEYVSHRIRAAGGDLWVFDEDALREAHHASHGLPRQINNICDIALLLGCAAKAGKVDRDLMLQAISEVNTPMLRGEAYEGIHS